MLLLLLVGVGALAVFVSGLNRATEQLARDRTTDQALAQAKAALIGYAAGVDLSGSKRPGDLPCPDLDNDGVAETLCGNAAGTTYQAQRLGRLPWKTLDLPDLRDGYGERLWYAVSNNFKQNARTTCNVNGQPGCLNSDSVGTISLRNQRGTIILDATGTSGAAAVVISPGASVIRQDGVEQNRNAANANNPVHFLDCYGSACATEDNGNFVDSQANGFIQGDVRDSNGNLVVNDRVLAITPDDLLPVLEKRVAAEVMICLRKYAAKAQNKGHYPWAAQFGVPLDFGDDTNALFGRVPDTPFVSTQGSSGDEMDDSWTSACKISSGSGWWLNWKEHVIYALAPGCQPVNPLPSTAGCSATLLAVNPPSAVADKELVVIVSGKRLSTVSGGQPRNSSSDKASAANYLEDGNAGGVSPYKQARRSATFNDKVVFRP